MNESIEEFLRQNEAKDLLRFATAGSIDDGKSTLIGRLLHDSKGVYEDQLASVRKASREKSGDEQIDFAMLTDGLKVEREQGITIDVAYRYFSTPKRKFIIADTPGHEQYTRNMATGASMANLSIVLVDARHGILPQTRRHSFITSLLGVPHLVVAVNKMDLVDYAESVFESIRKEYVDFAAKLTIPDIRFIPISALQGDNVVHRSSHMPWYRGESLLELLENVYTGSDHNLVDMRFPVQYVLRPHLNFRGYAGQLASGVIRAGDEIMVLPSRKRTRVKSIVTYDGEIDCAFPPMSVVVTLADEIDISRGDMLVHPHNVPRTDRRFEAMLVWMSETPMALQSPLWLKHTTRTTRVRVDEVRYRVNVNTLSREPAAPLALNEIARVTFTATAPIFHDPYDRNRLTGSFILIDPISNNTVAAGMMIDREPAESATPHPADLALSHRISRISPRERAQKLGQGPATLWLTGLVGAGKTAIAYTLEQHLFDLGAAVLVLDGENLRLGVNRELGFTDSERAEHLRRAAEIARLANDSGLLVICAFASPSAASRQLAAEIIGSDRFLEIHAKASLEWCEQHDTSGLYARARKGLLDDLPGIGITYEPPVNPALTIDTPGTTPDAATTQILDLLRDRGIFPLRESKPV